MSTQISSVGFSPLACAAIAAASEASDSGTTVSEALAACGGDQAVNPVARALASELSVVASPAVTAPKRNLTAEWLSKNYARVRPLLLAQVAAKFPVSRASGHTEDHVQEFLAGQIERDTLAPHIEAGGVVRDSVLRFWVTQKTASEVRSWATDACARTATGARTTRERSRDKGPTRRKDHENTMHAIPVLEDGVLVGQDYTDPMASSVVDVLSWEERREACFQAIENGVTSHKVPQYRSVLSAILEGVPVKEIPDVLGMSPATVGTIRNRLRTILAADVLDS